MNILFLSVSAGGGHGRAAEAVKERIDLKYPSSRTMIVDALKYISPLVDRLIMGSYINTIKKTPNIYRKLYRLSEYDSNIINISNNIFGALSGKLQSLINNFNPSAIVCTHPITLQMVSYLKKRNNIFCPVIAVITDFTEHILWRQDGIDAYVVGHEFIKEKMIDTGISPSIIHNLGIPVSMAFLERKNKKKLLNKLGLNDHPTALIMGGSLGFGEMYTAFQILQKSKKVSQIIAITGKNQKLKTQLENSSQVKDKKVKILGYTNLVADYMEVSDFIITKPGGLTISEALIKELPIFIMSPIPGQEEKNAQFLVNSGAAVRITPEDNIDSILRQTLENPLRLRYMKEMSRSLAKPHAAEDIMLLLEELTYQNLRNTVKA